MNRPEDNLEQYIRANRKKFDRYRPHPSVRRALFAKRPGGRTILMRSSFTRAAAVAVLIGCSMLLAYNTGIRRSSNMRAAMSPELRETEVYYETLVSSVFSRANTLFADYPGLETEIRADIGELEQIGRELMDDLKDNVANREVVEALIRNYRLRIQLLEDLMENLPDENDKMENAVQNEI
jgi:hypothetical protein